MGSCIDGRLLGMPLEMIFLVYCRPHKLIDGTRIYYTRVTERNLTRITHPSGCCCTCLERVNGRLGSVRRHVGWERAVRLKARHAIEDISAAVYFLRR